ncbi:SusC/RagA family TonB-linked outer membrane protein [Mangrovibacterium sp.]|uniref:SusC/RagA family TonB-linked outer membrane protein n=1 Tax=Mangrovibacterium sp. TaxID=1961364 RepID=UPI00356A46B1
MKKILTILMMVMTVSVYAQRQNISGKVTDSTGEALPGVTVVLKGTTQGTLTDANGNYSFQVPATAKTLVFSFIGMQTQEVPIAGKVVVNCVLSIDNVELDEVVAVGYGTMKKSDITGSVASIKTDELSRSGTISLDQALAGKAAGVTVTQSSGVPGAGSFIKIRGISSMQGSDPLYVIDGVPMDNTSLSSIGGGESGGQLSPLSSINPNDIEAMEILKDASATAIYGSRGANGVVLITTKSGKSGTGKIEVNAEYGIAAVPEFIELQDANQYVLTRYEGLYNAGSLGSGYTEAKLDSARAGLLSGTNWQEAIYQQGKTQNYNLSLSGGNQDVKYMVTSNFFDASGVIPKSDFNRVSTRVNLDAKINKYFDFGTRLYYAAINSTQAITTTGYNTNQGLNSVINRMLLASPLTGLNADDTDAGFSSYSPFTALYGNDFDNFISQFLGNMFINLKLAKGLTFKTDFSYQIRNSSQRFYQYNVFTGALSKHGWAKTNDTRIRLFSNTNTLNYNVKFKDHRITAVLGQSIEKSDNTAISTSNYNFANDLLTYYNLGTALVWDPDDLTFSDNTLASFFVRANYSYKNKLLLTLTARADGSSKFAANNKWGYFPAAAIGYRLTEEPFMKNIKQISNVKLRFSYGQSGSQAVKPYQSLDQLSSAQTTMGDGGGGEVLSTTFAPSQLPNADLRWETSIQTNGGLDLGFIDNRYTLTIDYYHKLTNDLLAVGNRIPSQSGFRTYTENYGQMESTGLELGLSAQIISKPKMSWIISGTVSTGKTKIKDMASDYVFAGYDGGIVPGGSQRLIIGEEVGAFYGYELAGISQFSDFAEFEGLSPQEQADLYKSNNPLTIYTPLSDENGLGTVAVRPGEQLFVDSDEDGTITDSDRKIIGYAQPDLVFGLSNTFSYGNFELNFNIDGQLGQDVCNVTNYNLMNFGSGQQLAVVRQAWTADNPSTEYPRLQNGTTFRFSSRYIEDASFVRLQNVTLSYNLPNSFLRKVKIKGAKLFVSGSNLLTITDYTGYNPDVSLTGNNTKSMGHDNAGYPVSRTFRVGVNFSL